MGNIMRVMGDINVGRLGDNAKAITTAIHLHIVVRIGNIIMNLINNT